MYTDHMNISIRRLAQTRPSTSEDFKMRAELLSNAFLIPPVVAANVSQFPWFDTPQAEHPIAHPMNLAEYVPC
jgi:hypothetical protein